MNVSPRDSEGTPPVPSGRTCNTEHMASNRDVTRRGPAGYPQATRRTVDAGSLAILIDAPADPDALVRAGEASSQPSPGYWAHLWPSAIMLAAHLARSSLIAPGVRVLEIGCGLGLCGIATAKRGAEVTLTDFNPDAVDAAARNALLNAVAVRCERFDWNDAPPAHWDGVDLIIASDVLYGADGVRPIAQLVRRLGCPAMIADPLRPQSADAAAAFEREGLRVWSTPAEGGRIMMLSEG